jgi:hypothetical protein
MPLENRYTEFQEKSSTCKQTVLRRHQMLGNTTHYVFVELTCGIQAGATFLLIWLILCAQNGRVAWMDFVHYPGSKLLFNIRF